MAGNTTCRRGGVYLSVALPSSAAVIGDCKNPRNLKNFKIMFFTCSFTKFCCLSCFVYLLQNFMFDLEKQKIAHSTEKLFCLCVPFEHRNEYRNLFQYSSFSLCSLGMYLTF